jgi:Photosynthetic reaction centre cytochrome C subunit
VISKLMLGMLVSGFVLSVLASRLSLGGAVKGVTAAEPGSSIPAAAAPRSKNLQVLPVDTPYADVVLLMTRYSQELGVQCVFCHAQNPRTDQIDFASDESPAKLTARIMIGMVRDINDKYLAQVSDRRYAVAITCGNCHQGRTFPPAFEAKSTQ